jgi:hypothetical protein
MQRLDIKKTYLSKGIKVLLDSDFITTKTKVISDGKGIIKKREIFLTAKSLSIFTEKKYLSAVVHNSQPVVHSSQQKVDYSELVTYKEPITTEPINSFLSIPFEIASAISSNAKNASEVNILPEKKDSEKEKSRLDTEPKQKFEGFAPEVDLELLAHRIIKTQELDGFAVSELLSNTEKVDINLNGDFYKFNLILKEQVQKYILQNLLNISSNN